MKISTINIQAKEWFDKRHGNSYFSAVVTLDFGMDSEKTIYIPFQYGYGEHYLTIVKDQLRTDGILPDEEIYHLSQWCEDNGIILRYSKRENCLKKDVVLFGSN